MYTLETSLISFICTLFRPVYGIYNHLLWNLCYVLYLETGVYNLDGLFNNDYGYFYYERGVILFPSENSKGCTQTESGVQLYWFRLGPQ